MSEGLIAITEGSGKNVSTQSMTIGGQTVHIERSMMGIGVLTLPGSPQISGVSTPDTLYPNDLIDIQGRYYVVLKTLFSLDTNTAQIRFAFYDSDDVLIGYSDALDIGNTGIGTAGAYYGQAIVWANVFGAKSLKIYLDSITAGSISIYVGVV